MNPIYKFQLSAGNTIQQAFPIYKDDLAKDYEKESNQEFFRAKLSGKLTFESDDYAFIVSKAFDTQFVLEIFISYNAGQSWTSYWRGTFWKTDCEFDADAETVIVQPTVWDQYNDVLAGLDKEYNLIELAPEIAIVNADKRPMVQVYVPGQSVIGCFLSGMWWEQECEPESNENKLSEIGNGKLNFALNKTMTFAEVSGTMSPELPKSFSKTFSGDERFNPRAQGTQEFPASEYKLVYFYGTSSGGALHSWTIIRISDNVSLWRFAVQEQVPPLLPLQITLTPISGSGATGDVDLYIHDLPVYSRLVCDTQTIVIDGSTLNTYEIAADDIVENNRNYHYVIGYDFPSTIIFSTAKVSTPTQWGLYQPGQYYYNPADNPLLGLGEAFPVARNAWGIVSIWFVFSSVDWVVESSARQPFTIRHAYPIWSVISVLLAKIAPEITHAGTTDYSQFLYGTNLIGIKQTLLITPKSNLVTAGYDQPAQKAPITLKNVLDMLRDCFRCYWFIDDQNRFRVEHIQYFRNGGSYSGSPVVGIDLTAQQVSRNGKPWAFGRNQYQFDKPRMAARYQFGWMDDVTQLFEGFPIDIISKYVNPDNIEQIDVSRFTSDIDYILLNPGEISKDGFVLMSGQSENYLSETIEKSGTPSNGIAFTEFSLSQFNGKMVTVRVKSTLAGVKLAQFDGFFEYEDIGILEQANTEYSFTFEARELFVVMYDASANFVGSLIAVYADMYKLPYLNYIINSSDHYLQNAYVAFFFLQQYYAYDMPARQYEINDVQMVAQGIKKLKTQILRFPVLNDPDLVQLVKTNLGNGVIEKLSVNLSSRNANATLKYDTE